MKTVVVDNEVWEKLQLLKLKWKKPTVGKVVRDLVVKEVGEF